MSRILLSAAALAVVAFSLPTMANAQHRASIHGKLAGGAQHVAPFGGYGFAPKRQRGGFGINGFYSTNSYNSFHRPDNLPYFAQNPPVYYSRDIVKRPYGVSPYAAPPGIVPTEVQMLNHGVKSAHIVNPYVAPIHSDSVIHPPVAPSVTPNNDAPTVLPPSKDLPLPEGVEQDSGSDKKGNDSDWEIVPDKNTDT